MLGGVQDPHTPQLLACSRHSCIASASCCVLDHAWCKQWPVCMALSARPGCILCGSCMHPWPARSRT
eukprot:11276321-Alexandrium_andersonii.AAC.1